MKTDWRILVHGGAGSMQRGRIDSIAESTARDGLEAALGKGSDILRAGGSALDAVETAVRVLEEDPAFNAGRGSVLAHDGHVELDAAVMDGRTRRAGAVAGLRTTRSPVSLARCLTDKGPHVFLSGPDADSLARDEGLEQVDNRWFETPERRAQLEYRLRDGGFDDEVKYGTVGAVALDWNGRVAAATSTGGLTAKRWGRIGDSPVIGAGTYADDRSCAASATGSGEYFLRVVAAHELSARVRLSGESLQPALDGVLAEILSLGGKGGMIAIAPDGRWASGFTTPGMYRGVADARRLSTAIYGDEELR